MVQAVRLNAVVAVRAISPILSGNNARISYVLLYIEDMNSRE